MQIKTELLSRGKEKKDVREKEVRSPNSKTDRGRERTSVYLSYEKK